MCLINLIAFPAPTSSSIRNQVNGQFSSLHNSSTSVQREMAAQSGTEPSWKQVSRTWCLHRDSTLSKVNPPLLDVAKESEKLRNVTGIPRQLLEPREVELTEMTTEALLEQLSSGRLLSTEVVNAFLRRAALAQKLVRTPVVFCIPFLYPSSNVLD